MSSLVDISTQVPKITLYICSFILSTFFYPTIIDSFLNRFPKLTHTETNMKSINENDIELGKIIGLLERVIILTAIFSENYLLIPMLLTAKSIIRFPDAERSKLFAEYYLIGTLTSFILALLTGIIIKECTML